MNANEFVKGIDVSNHQGIIDWTRANRTDITFVYALVSDGDNFEGNGIGEAYRRNKQGCTKPFGAYHFARPANTNPLVSAENVVAAGNHGRVNDMPFMLDLELGEPQSSNRTLSHDRWIDWTSRWLNHVEFLDGRRPIIYAGSALASVANHFQHIWWYPSYPNNAINPDPYHWDMPANGAQMWQYSSSGRVDGISANVDMTVCHALVLLNLVGYNPGSTDIMRKFFGVNGENGQYRFTQAGPLQRQGIPHLEARAMLVQGDDMADETIWLTDWNMIEKFRAIPEAGITSVDPVTLANEIAARITHAEVPDPVAFANAVADKLRSILAA